MLYRVLADLVVATHFMFIIFVVAGGLLVVKRRSVAWFHVPAVIWGSMAVLARWICPLTPLENALREKAGEAGYQTGFIEHYLLPVIYPGGSTRTVLIALGALLVALNLAIYVWVIRRSFSR